MAGARHLGSATSLRFPTFTPTNTPCHRASFAHLAGFCTNTSPVSPTASEEGFERSRLGLNKHYNGVTRLHARRFYYGIRLLPPHKRAAMSARRRRRCGDSVNVDVGPQRPPVRPWDKRRTMGRGAALDDSTPSADVTGPSIERVAHGRSPPGDSA